MATADNHTHVLHTGMNASEPPEGRISGALQLTFQCKQCNPPSLLGEELLLTPLCCLSICGEMMNYTMASRSFNYPGT
mgnify:CR=1 FL=1